MEDYNLIQRAVIETDGMISGLEATEAMMKRAQKNADLMGMKINEEKTKIMAVSCNRESEIKTIVLNGNSFKVDKNMKILGYTYIQ